MKILLRHPIYADNSNLTPNTANAHGGRESTISRYLKTLFNVNKLDNRQREISNQLILLFQTKFNKIALHHIDYDRKQNDSSNIVLIDHGVHTLLHSNLFYKCMLYKFYPNRKQSLVGSKAFEREKAMYAKLFELEPFSSCTMKQFDTKILSIYNDNVTHDYAYAFIEDVRKSYVEVEEDEISSDTREKLSDFLSQQLKYCNDSELSLGIKYLIKLLEDVI